LPWRSWRDGRAEGQGPIARAWNVSRWPTVYVLDARGVIRYRDVTGQDLDDAVDALLQRGAASALRASPARSTLPEPPVHPGGSRRFVIARRTDRWSLATALDSVGMNSV